MKKRKKIDLNRKDIVIAYTVLRITVGLVLITTLHTGKVKFNYEFLVSIFSINLHDIVAFFSLLLTINLIAGCFNRLTIIILLSINTLSIVVDFSNLQEGFKIVAEAPNLDLGLEPLKLAASYVIQTCLYHCLLLVLLVCNSFNDFSADAWYLSNEKNYAKRMKKQGNKENQYKNDL